MLFASGSTIITMPGPPPYGRSSTVRYTTFGIPATQTLDEAPSSIDQSQFFEGARDTNVVDGKTYGVPWYVETRVLYYRTDIADKALKQKPV